MAPRVSAFTVRFDKGRAVSAPLYTGRRKTTVAQLRKFVVGEIGDVWYMMFINGYPSGRKGLKLHKGAYVEVWTASHYFWTLFGALCSALLSVGFMFAAKPFHGLETIPWLAMMGSAVHALVKASTLLPPAYYDDFMRGMGHNVDRQAVRYMNAGDVSDDEDNAETPDGEEPNSPISEDDPSDMRDHGPSNSTARPRAAARPRATDKSKGLGPTSKEATASAKHAQAGKDEKGKAPAKGYAGKEAENNC